MMKTNAPLPSNEACALPRLAQFLSVYAAMLLSCGSTTQRVQKNVERIAQRYDASVMVTSMPLHVDVTVIDRQTQASHMATEMCSRGINFYAITALSALSWRIFEHMLSLEAAQRELEVIKRHKRIPIWQVTLLAGVANASFCRLFEGDYWAMAFVFLATVCGFYMRCRLVEQHIDFRAATILAACVSTIIACGPHLFHLGATPEVAVATSVLYLVPGIPFINSFSDLINGHYICAIGRFLWAMETTVCLGLGLWLGNLIINFH
ncbi:MAG: threonine/serine exporter family protein [Bacteroidales bacterium]|nr:threonine/serine exporter family protein [Bacteroidales bacterium]